MHVAAKATASVQIGCLLFTSLTLQVFVFDRLVDDDSIMGDKNGPFEPAVQARLRRIRNLVSPLALDSYTLLAAET